ncbi:MAG TPA: DNA (cytosine-5-)-methyltransferase [Planctomycetota bacterium]|nr:DNA (cytosine-5-)-methyltransferase [Planctomycetota bacterium]
MRFVDLFAGLGGFHLALKRLGHECVFASEIDAELQRVYCKNFGMMPTGDIRAVSPDDIPSHDVLCAGFPCQPFSKAGEQQGLECTKWGNLFDSVSRILRHHRPRFVILENVANFERHDSGRTWNQRIRRRLLNAGYSVSSCILSPHKFGVPQIRERFFAVASRSGLGAFSWPKGEEGTRLSISTVLDTKPPDATPLSNQGVRCLNAWQDLIEAFPKWREIPSPIWSMEFGATYDFESSTPYSAPLDKVKASLGAFGTKLSGGTRDEILGELPSHARYRLSNFPEWKKSFIRENRRLFEENRPWMKRFVEPIKQFPSSLQKLEWNCKGETRNIWTKLIQFRASGVRVKRPTTAPSLVAMTTTQVPIVGWELRYMTPRECARLQSLNDLIYLPEAKTRAFRALGNGVNAKIVELVARSLFSG